MNCPFTDAFDKACLQETMMGPNAMRVTEELASFLPLKKGDRVLDLGCGMGISSILLASKYEVEVFAADLWIPPAENAARFAALGLDKAIIPFSVDATKDLPFAHGYFDSIVSVDSYHYFGCGVGMLPSLLPFLKPGGTIAMAVPGLQREFYGAYFPEELQPYREPDMNFHSREWWRSLWEKSLWRQNPGASIASCRDMDCCRQAWDEWLASPNPYARSDAGMMKAEAGRYYSIVQITAQKN